jgi:O-antigen/teichoic acid export membrane protein
MNRGAAVMVVLTILASATNYASSLIFSRVLNPVGFGELTALLAFAVVLAVPTGAAQTVIAERIAVHAAAGRHDAIRYLLRHAIAHVGLIATIATLVYIASIPLVVELFDLQHPGPAIALVPVIFMSFIQPIVLGVLQGLDRFAAFGGMLLAIAFSRIAFGVPWAAAGGGAGGAIAGQGIGMVVVMLVGFWVLRDLLMRRGTGAATAGLRRRLDRRTISASAAFIAFAVISNLDVLLAKVFLSPREVGVYAAVATVGKVVTFLPAAIAVVMVPNAARAHHEDRSGNRVLRMAARLVALTAIVAAVPAAAFPDLVVEIMFGDGYEDAASGVLPIVVAGGCLAMLNLLVVYAVAIRDAQWFLLIVGGVGLQVALITVFHDSPTEVAWAQAAACLALLVVNEIRFHSMVRPAASRG